MGFADSDPPNVDALVAPRPNLCVAPKAVFACAAAPKPKNYINLGICDNIYDSVNLQFV